MSGLGQALRHSRLVHLWAVASTAWLIHATQHVVRHGGVLLDMAPGAAMRVLWATLLDVARPIALTGAAVLILATLTAGALRWRR